MTALDISDTALQMTRLMAAAGVLIAAFDQDDRLRFANEAFRAAWFIAPDEFP